jgi:hypothetical protein
MNAIIDADAAKLAGLQIDTLQKVRSGQITLSQWERFNNLSTNDREAQFGDVKKPEPKAPEEPMEKFTLLVDLGIITVPEDYVHDNRLKIFNTLNLKAFYYYNDAITDQNFPNPTRILKPGDKLRVRAFQQAKGGTSRSEDRMAFLATQKAVHTGAQGASLVFDQKRFYLPKGKWYVSFDEPDRLWKDAEGGHRVPYLDCYSNVIWFDLGFFEDVWGDDSAFLCFCDAE